VISGGISTIFTRIEDKKITTGIKCPGNWNWNKYQEIGGDWRIRIQADRRK
jgi:hypothetical protein